jgi:hypothetical protein
MNRDGTASTRCGNGKGRPRWASYPSRYLRQCRRTKTAPARASCDALEPGSKHGHTPPACSVNTSSTKEDADQHRYPGGVAPSNENTSPVPQCVRLSVDASRIFPERG